MENKEREMAERLEAATTLLERALGWLEERQSALTGEVEKISATVEQNRREAELTEKLAAAEREVAELKAAGTHNALNPLRKTMPAATTEMLAKHGIGEADHEFADIECAG
jgi:hypothetical protein